MTDSTRAKRLIDDGDTLFNERGTLMSLWQEIAWNFYVERADFTMHRVIGNTFADQLMTSYPLLARRELGNAISSILRPEGQEWFAASTDRPDKVDDQGVRWLYLAGGVIRRAMYDRRTSFRRATTEADHDFAAFGQAVLSAEMNAKHDGLLYRDWHLRDVAWSEGPDGSIQTVHRKWKLEAHKAVAMFPKTISARVKKIAETKPYEKVNLRHIMMQSEYYNECVIDKESGKRIRQPYVSVYIDEMGTEILEEAGKWTAYYIIPRWQTVSGSQYAYSPATVAALPDARLLQAVTMTLLEAGEKYTNPPLIAVQEAIRADVDVTAGGITWVDREYDERLGEVLRPLTQDKSGYPIGEKARQEIASSISACFFLDKLGLPPVDAGRNERVTAFEVQARMQDYIRKASPLFAPMQPEYNGAMCDMTFEIILRNGGFGSFQDIPQSIRGQQTVFNFSSPLSEMVDAQLSQKLTLAKQILATVVDLDPAQAKMLDVSVSLRDALLGAGVPPTWVRTHADMAAIEQQVAKQQQAQALLQQVGQGSVIAKNMGVTGQMLAGGGQGPTGGEGPSAPPAAGGSL